MNATPLRHDVACPRRAVTGQLAPLPCHRRPRFRIASAAGGGGRDPEMELSGSFAFSLSVIAPPGQARRWRLASIATCSAQAVTRASLSAACALVLFLGAAPPSAPWHLAGWQQRAVLTIPQPQADGQVDTAAIRILCQGQ